MEKTTTLNHIAENVLTDIRDSLKDAAGDIKDKGKEMMKDVRAKGDDMLEETVGTGKKMLRGSKKWIKKNPTLAIVAAVGILWFVFGRGNKD